MMEHVTVDSDIVMESNHMPLEQPQGPVSESSYSLDDVLDIGAFAVDGEEWQEISVF